MKLGIIGGSGLYEMEYPRNLHPVHVDTPFGAPSDAYMCGKVGSTEVFFLARHGRGHRKMPSEINHRANIFGFKTLGIERIVGITAVGSLREDYRPRDVVLPDQYFDRTKSSDKHTFFGNGVVAHVSFGDPICPDLRKSVRKATESVIAAKSQYVGIKVHDGGTYVNMEGPAFSTKAESHTYRKLGFDVIGMTSLAEAKLCREAEICYASISLVTDYDCWHESVEPVTVEMVIETLKANAGLAQDLLRKLIGSLKPRRNCSCGTALKNALITPPDSVPTSVKRSLKPIIGKYIK